MSLVVPGDGYQIRLDNGLMLFVAPDEHTRAVQFDVRHAVGSRDDPPGKTQLAHLVEHLMFELPTDGPGSADLGDEARERSLYINAYTSPDETHYTYTGSEAQLETYVRHAARRLGFGCDELDPQTVEREREVVLNEIRWRRQGVDTWTLDRLRAAAFGEGHPYRVRVHDEETQLVSVTRQDICDFVARHYTPARTTVIITGNVTPERALELVDAHLALLPAGASEPREPVPAFVPASEPVIIEAPVAAPSGVLLFATPPRFSEDYAAIDLARPMIGHALELFTEVEKGHVQDWGFVALGGKQAPILGITVVPKEPEQLDLALEETGQLIEVLFSTSLPDVAYDQARQLRRREIVGRVAHIESRATAYADYLEEGSEPGFVGADLAAIDRLTAAQVGQAALRVFSADRSTTAKIVPSSETTQADRVRLDVAPRPEPFGTESLHIPDDITAADAHEPITLGDLGGEEVVTFEDLELSNGMRVILVGSSQYPLVEIQLIIHGGTLHTPEQPLVASLADDLYVVRDREALGLAMLFGLAGGGLDRSISPRTTVYRAQGLSIYVDFLIAGLAETHAYGDYLDGSFERWKAAAQEGLYRPDFVHGVSQAQAYMEALYGKGHPYAQVVGDIGRLRRADVKRFHDRHYRAASSTVVVTGSFDREVVLAYLEHALAQPRDLDWTSSWGRPRAETVVPQVPMPRLGTDLTRVAQGQRTTDVLIGFPLQSALGPKHAALAVLTQMLDHEAKSVREILGASYGIDAMLHLDWPRIEVGGSVDSRRAGESLIELRKVLARVSDEDFERRFAHARRVVLRTLLEAHADPQRLGAQVAAAVSQGLAPDYFTRQLPQRVATLRPEVVRAELDRVLSTERAVVFVQGPAHGVEDATKTAGLGALVLPPL